MKRLLSLAVSLVICAGCMPYQDEYEKAMAAKAEVERKYEEAKVEAENAKKALSAEQNAVKRIYNED